MVGGAVLNHQRDSAAQLPIDAFNDQRVIAQNRIKAAADMQQRHIVLGERVELRNAVMSDGGVVGVNARHFVRVVRSPGVCVAAAAAHADEGRLLGEAVLFGQECVPGVPRFAGIAQDEADVKAALEQFNLGLRFMVEIIATPGPRFAWGRIFRHDHDAPQLAFHLSSDTVSFVGRGLERLDGQVRLVHQKVKAIESVPGRLFAGEAGHVGRKHGSRNAKQREAENGREDRSIALAGAHRED